MSGREDNLSPVFIKFRQIIDSESFGAVNIEEASFFQRVYEVVKQIPYGRVTTYGAVAAYLGSRKSARMVGWAMNVSHTSGEDIPAHRVVNRNGQLTGKHYFGGNTIMQQLLESEGVMIENDTVLHFSRLFWDPLRHMPAPDGQATSL